MISPDQLYVSPNALADHYRRFRVGERVLLSGHSHQAWPDAGYTGQIEAFDDAAEFVDTKWERAFAKAGRVRKGYARLLGDDANRVALGQSTLELVARLLSGLDLRARPQIVTTDGEFHTIRRMLDRLSEDYLDVIKVPWQPVENVAERLAAAVTEKTAVAMVSAVYYKNARIVPGLRQVMDKCRAVGAEFLVDAYHAANIVPFELTDQGLADAFVTGGGYKYCQLGEGNCFLRFPEGCKLRPVLTGWYGEFSALTDDSGRYSVGYAEGPMRFAGATYDPTSNYRAAAVFDFFEDQGLDVALLREVSQHQMGVLAEKFDALDADPAIIRRDRDVPLSEIAGFLSFTTPRAQEFVTLLREREVFTDCRGETLRVGPAPYLSDAQLVQGIDALSESIRLVSV